MSIFVFSGSTRLSSCIYYSIFIPINWLLRAEFQRLATGPPILISCAAQTAGEVFRNDLMFKRKGCLRVRNSPHSKLIEAVAVSRTQWPQKQPKMCSGLDKRHTAQKSVSGVESQCTDSKNTAVAFKRQCPFSEGRSCFHLVPSLISGVRLWTQQVSIPRHSLLRAWGDPNIMHKSVSC